MKHSKNFYPNTQGFLGKKYKSNNVRILSSPIIVPTATIVLGDIGKKKYSSSSPNNISPKLTKVPHFMKPLYYIHDVKKELGEDVTKYYVKRAPKTNMKKFKMLFNEAKMLHNLNNANIVSCYGISQTSDEFLVIMENAAHGSIGEYLSKLDRALTVRETIGFLIDIASALKHLHVNNHMNHGDVKASNVVITSDLRAKLSDFECSIFDFEQYTSEVYGSLLHLAPELLRKRVRVVNFSSETEIAYDRYAADVYAFGILMYEILHPKKVPYGEIYSTSPGCNPEDNLLSTDEFIEKVIHDDVRPTWTNFSEPQFLKLKRLAEKCWSLNPASRPSASDLLQSFKVINNDLEEPVLFSFDDCNNDGDDDQNNNNKSNVALAMVQGERYLLEDFSCIIQNKNFIFLCLFDGHGGVETAEFAHRFVSLKVCESLHKTNFRDGNVRTILKEADEEIKNHKLMGGTCALISLSILNSEFVEKNGGNFKLHTYWLGDSNGFILGNKEKVLHLVQAHTPDRQDEWERIVRSGGECYRQGVTMDNGEIMPQGPHRMRMLGEKSGFAPSRGLGNFSMKKIMIADCEESHFTLTRDVSFVILGSDGLFFDGMRIDELVKFREENNNSSVESFTFSIVAQALVNGSADNVTAICVDFNGFRNDSSSSSRKTHH